MKHGVLKHWHPMVGVDWHIPWPPGSPSPAPAAVPYRTGMLMIGTGLGVLAGMTKPTEKQMTDAFSMTMLKGTDIGPMIPHIGAPSVTLPVEMAFSSSKSHFSTSRYHAGGQPVAVSLLTVVSPNLNCGTPLPTPTGFVFALTAHRVDMTFGDIFGGFGAMFGDWCVQAVLNKLGSALGSRLSGFLQARLFNRYIANWTAVALRGGGDEALARSWAGVMAASRAERGASIAAAVFEGTLAFLSGGPMGADIAALGGYGEGGWTPGGQLGDTTSGFYEGLGQAFGDYLEGPGPGDYPLPDPSAPMA
jgi:hypothetical protein